MKKLVGLLLLSTGLLTGCGEEKQDVVNLSYVDAHWTVSKYSLEQPVVLESAGETLAACTGDLTTELKGDLTVFDTVVASRHPMTDTGWEYGFKAVTYIQGDENYAMCRDMASPHYSVEMVDAFPEFVDLTAGHSIRHYPSVRPADEAARLAVQNADELTEAGNEIEPFPDTVMAFSPAIHGEIELTVGDRPSQFPLFAFEPMMADVEDVKLAIGYDSRDAKPYVLLLLADLYVSVSPLHTINDPTKEEPTYDDLVVKRLPLDTELVPNKTYPLYEFSYTRDGEAVTETASITYRAAKLLSTDERKTLETHPNEEYMPIVTGPLVYLHQEPFDNESTVSYPAVLRAAGNEMDDLIQAIDSAEPTKRVGDQGDYPLLTIVDGLKGQEFKVTYKQRSKKLDIYVTDQSTEETYKLTSEGAETFLSYFPDLKKKPKN